jgi:FkbM family methyltransferase
MLEKLSRRRVLQRRLPPEHGGHALRVSPDASMKFWLPGLAAADPQLLSWAASLVRPGDTVWDVGANVGLFAFAAAFAAGPSGSVLALEADEWLAGLLRESARTAPAAYARVEVLAVAASDAPGFANFLIANRGRAGNHLEAVHGSTQTGGAREVRRVETVTLDGLLDRFPTRPAVVKIDVEGAEVQCLRGAERLLAEVRPALLCEVTRENAEAVREILHRHRYTLFDASAPADRREPIALPAWNTLALPA